MGKAEEVSILSKHTVRPSSPRAKTTERIIHLTPWDLRMICSHYIQKGILFYKPQHQSTDLVISDLLTSFSHALDHFYPFAGRLSTTQHDDSDSISISLNCTDQGAEFVHASASNIKVSEILSSYYIPPIVHSLFPLNGIINHDGHSHPLLAVQVTELADGIFIACSLNHTVVDGTSFWHFFNTWSTICRTQENMIEHPPVFQRWFPDSCPPPIQLPFTDHQQFIKRVKLTQVQEGAFKFSAQSIKKLKAQANEEIMGRLNISSLQALLAHAWRAVTRARSLNPEQETTYVLAVGHRTRLRPPLAKSYVGNSFLGVPIKALVEELETKGLGWTAVLLNQAVASQRVETVHHWMESWIKSPSLVYPDKFSPSHVATGSSPRFDVYGNDFGWGRPVAVCSGPGLKVDGKMTVYPGLEEGAMSLEICLKEEAIKALVEDREFMQFVA